MGKNVENRASHKRAALSMECFLYIFKQLAFPNPQWLFYLCEVELD